MNLGEWNCGGLELGPACDPAIRGQLSLGMRWREVLWGCGPMFEGHGWRGGIEASESMATRRGR